MQHESLWDELCTTVADAMQELGVPGVALGVLDNDQVVTTGFGVTNVEHPLAVTSTTLFQLGSITKTFTAMAILRLVKMGKLNLDQPIHSYAPQFSVADAQATATATLRHLLTHTADWEGDFFIDTGAGDDAAARYAAAMAELEQVAPIGSLFSYNNAAFYLAGYIIEQVTGKPLAVAIKELVLEPLGMHASCFDAADVITHRFAVGHHTTSERSQVARPWALPRAGYSAGGLVCHVDDLLKYARFHLGDGTTTDGTRLLPASALAQMHTPQQMIWAPDAAMGLSWFINTIQGVQMSSHGGGTNGQIASLLLVPTRRFALAVLTNDDQSDALIHTVSKHALQHYLGLVRPDPAPIAAADEVLMAYAGRYSLPSTDIELVWQDGHLMGQFTYKIGFPTQDDPPPSSPPPFPLGLSADDRLVVVEGPLLHSQAEVIRKADRTIGWLRFGGRLHRRVI